MLEDWRNVDLNSITKQTLYTMEDSQEEHRQLIIHCKSTHPLNMACPYRELLLTPTQTTWEEQLFPRPAESSSNDGDQKVKQVHSSRQHPVEHLLFIPLRWSWRVRAHRRSSCICITFFLCFFSTVYQEFDRLLEEQSPIEAYIEWLDSMVDRCVVKVRLHIPTHLFSLLCVGSVFGGFI